MSRLLRSYLNFARGDVGFSVWSVLIPVQYAMQAWMKLRIALYNRGIFPITETAIPVISIGNNSLGGTNKTPMAEFVVRKLKEAGIESGLVSRGYRTKNRDPIWIGQDERSLTREMAGDEPLMLAKHLPGVKVVVSKDRVRGVELLASLGVEAAVADDTFQHRRMARDVDIVLVDATCPFGNGKLIPAGLMREPMSAFGRADIIVITKSNQVSGKKLEEIRAKLGKLTDSSKIYTARIEIDAWMCFSHGGKSILPPDFTPPDSNVVFAAIGNPEGFRYSLESKGIKIAAERSYRDHRVFTAADIEKLDSLANEAGASALICTEKDLINLPSDAEFRHTLYVPRITVAFNNETAFCTRIAECLRPKIMIASNGHGEDAIGARLAKKMRERFKEAEVSAFTLVGSGRSYSNEDIQVLSPSVEMPSGGVIKYSARDLMRDLRHGLGASVRNQYNIIRALGGRYKTPVCVGDVYLLAFILWGQGLPPMLLATAKTARLSGHMFPEKFLMKHRSLFVWTRDEETAKELNAAGIRAAFSGSPVMDLSEGESSLSPWGGAAGNKVLLLPGSRERAYEDSALVLDAARILSKKIKCSFLTVLAPTLDEKKFSSFFDGWKMDESGGRINGDGVEIILWRGGVEDAARGADILIGLGGTANQLCAGLGLPVVSIKETGKYRQKQLLGDAEILTDASAEALAEAAYSILTDRELYNRMSGEGKRLLGRHGALDDIVSRCANVYGWGVRCSVYARFKKRVDEIKGGHSKGDGGVER